MMLGDDFGLSHADKRGDGGLLRTPPSTFASWLPFLPVRVNGPGNVTLSRTASEAFIAANPGAGAAGAGGNVAYVSPTGGAPGTAALNDRTKPYSLAYALQNLNVQRIIALDGVYAATDFRYTYAFGGVKKLVMAENPGGAIMRVASSDDLTTKTFTATAGRPNIWQTTYTGNYGQTVDSGGGAYAAIQRLCRTDIVDEWGYPTRFLRCYTLAALDAVTRGYYVDSATKTVYVKWDSADANTFKGALKPYWLDGSNNARVLLYGAEMCWDGWVFDGVNFAMLHTATLRPVLWLNSCSILFTVSYGINDYGSAAGHVYASNLRIHGTEADGINLNYNSTFGNSGRLALGNSWISNSGDFAGCGAAGTTNKQSLSSHGGQYAAFGCTFDSDYGEGVADTSTDPNSNESWYVGCVAKRGSTLAGSTGFAFYGSGTAGSRNRKVWLDSCAVSGSITVPLRLDGLASAVSYNCPTLTAVVSGGSVAPGNYLPASP
jgi:hypothetical protein